MTAPVRPPRDGLQTLAPEIARIVEALARVQEERDHAARPGKNQGGAELPASAAFSRRRKADHGITSKT